MANPRGDCTFTCLLIMYFIDGTNRECGEIVTYTFRTVRTGCEMSQRIVRTVQLLKIIHGS